MSNEKEIPEGIGGWLLLPTIGFFIGIIVYLLLAIVMTLSLIRGEGSLWKVLYVIISIVMVVLISYVLYLEFKKKQVFIKWGIALFWLGVFTTLLLSIEDGDYSSLSKQVIGAGIWTWYLFESKRVKKTFVN